MVVIDFAKCPHILPYYLRTRYGWAYKSKFLMLSLFKVYTANRSDVQFF